MFQPVIKINTKWTKDISVTVLLLFLIQSMFNNELRVIVYTFLLVAVFLLNKRIVVPAIYGARIYFISILIMIVYGFFVNDMSGLFKGTFYVINNIMIVIVGYYACRFERNKSLMKTLYFVCAIQLAGDWLKLLINIADIGTLGSLRNVFNNHIMDMMMFSVLLFYECVLNKKTIYGKKRDLFLILAIMVTVLVSLGRTQILCMIIGVFVAYIIPIIKAEKKQRFVMNLIVSTAVGVCLVFLTFLFLPEDFTAPFVNKVEKTFTELSTDNEFDDESSISSNWRGYEKKNAEEQWQKTNIAEQVFGQGIGTEIKLKNLPKTQRQEYGLTNSSTPLLHNGYYTLLTKGGVLAVFGILFWLLYPIRILSSKVKSKYLIDIYTQMLIVNVMMMVTTYVIRGLIGSGTFLVWGTIIGWNSCKLKQILK